MTIFCTHIPSMQYVATVIDPRDTLSEAIHIEADMYVSEVH